MNNHGMSSTSQREVIVQLLDPTYRRPVKTWRFAGRFTITIGRSDERDVEINDVYVSRLHAEILLQDDRWILASRGRNGVIVDSRPITELPLEGDLLFRLGSEGPTLRFSTVNQEEDSSSTLCFDTQTVPLFRLDKSKVQDEVGEITSGNYFQSLQQKAEELRRLRRDRQT